jgi:hypothetical protein
VARFTFDGGRALALGEHMFEILSNLVIPADMRKRVEIADTSPSESDANSRRMAEIEETGKRIDFSWEQDFIDQQVCAEKRR